MTEQQYKELKSKGRIKRDPLTKVQNSKARLQALGRLRDGEMNKTEAAYAAHLEAEKQAGEVLWYRFEGIKLKLAPNTHLTVDFAVLKKDMVLEMHDVKGSKAIVADDSKAKIKIAAATFPFRFCLVYPVPKKNGGGWMIDEVC